MGKGSILVRLFKVKDAIPIPIGKLKITTFESCEIVYENDDAFDLVGRSEIIEVDAPEQSLSLQPQECIIPYGRYNLFISTYGFEDASVQGISVFEGITSIQDIELIEVIQLSKSNNSAQVTIIPPHQLTLSVARDKQESVIIQPKELAIVNIPEFIVVHLGTPTSNAEDVTIGFSDYIKNVASSEIYATWPIESLKANIYCQISFALNRVYTEFYRNKGFPFQITNSTAYDQYFVKGRNIYENLSIIVDDIFSEYIITGGNLTPLFAQFCNGTTVTCPGWLSQWGTVYLANNGLSAIEILRYYYGDNHALIRAVIIEGVPESYPGIPLRLYSINRYVKVIQAQLNRISVNFPLIPIILPVDGNFGNRTLNSVKTFQSIFNLVQDGIVGRATWYKISGIYAAVTRLTGYIQAPVLDGQCRGDLLRHYSAVEFKEDHRDSHLQSPPYYLHQCNCPYMYSYYSYQLPWSTNNNYLKSK